MYVANCLDFAMNYKMKFYNKFAKLVLKLCRIRSEPGFHKASLGYFMGREISLGNFGKLISCTQPTLDLTERH